METPDSFSLAYGIAAILVVVASSSKLPKGQILLGRSFTVTLLPVSLSPTHDGDLFFLTFLFPGIDLHEEFKNCGYWLARSISYV